MPGTPTGTTRETGFVLAAATTTTLAQNTYLHKDNLEPLTYGKTLLALLCFYALVLNHEKFTAV